MALNTCASVLMRVQVAGWILELDRGAGIPFEGNYSGACACACLAACAFPPCALCLSVRVCVLGDPNTDLLR